jgi:hypothetical protein
MDGFESVRDFLIVLVSAFWLWLGVMAFRHPRHLLRGFGIDTQTIDARNEVRGIYGGFPLAMSAILIGSLFAPHLKDGIAICIGAATLGMCLGRAISGIIDHKLGKLPKLFGAIELAIAAILILPALVASH